MNSWRTNPVVKEKEGSVRFRHLLVKQVNGEGASLAGTIGSIVAADGTVAVGIGLKAKGDQSSRELGRTVARGRCLRALAGATKNEFGFQRKNLGVLKNEAFFRLFMMLAYTNPRRAGESLSFVRDELQALYPDLTLEFVIKLEQTSKVVGDPDKRAWVASEKMLRSILSNAEDVERINSITLGKPETPANPEPDLDPRKEF